MKQLFKYVALILLQYLLLNSFTFADVSKIEELLNIIQKDLRTLERAVYSESFSQTKNNQNSNDLTNKETEDILTRHLLKLSEIQSQFQQLTNRYEEINFKLDQLSIRLSKSQADNQLRFQQLENNPEVLTSQKVINEGQTDDIPQEKLLPGASKPQDLGTLSYKDMTPKNENQQILSVGSAETIISETFMSEEKILPSGSPKEQYEFATSFLKVGDYNMAERAFREFVDTNPDNELSGNAQYWYAETFRIRQLYTDAASAYLEGYQKYPESEKAPINLLKLGVSLVQIGEKDQGCLMIAGVKKQYPKATQSVLQKAKYEEKKFECKKENS